MTTRRHFLKGSFALATAAAFSQMFQIAEAQSKGHAEKLIIVFNYGGWDPTIVFDPKAPSSFVDVAPGKEKRFQNLTIWNDSSRPQVESFFREWGSMTAVVNGMAVRSIVHEECVEQVLTGVSLEQKPDIGAVIANRSDSNTIVPYLTLGGQAQPRELAALAAELGLTNQLPSLVVPSLTYPKPGSKAPHKGLGLDSSEQKAVQQYLKGRALTFQKLHGDKGRNGQRFTDYQTSVGRADKMSAFFQKSTLAEPRVVFRFSEKYPLVVQVLKENFSKVAFLQTDGWDTHSNVQQQEGMFNDLFEGLNGLMKELSKQKILDKTLVLVLSEMGRTPKRNKDKGKDHWPFTSAMLIGKQVRGGRMYGHTNKEVKPLPLDLSTGRTVASGGTDLRTVHLLASVMEMMGIDPVNHFGKTGVLRGLQG